MSCIDSWREKRERAMSKINLMKALTIQYDGRQLPENCVVETIDRQAFPKVDNISTELPGRDGKLFRRRSLNEKIIRCNIRLFMNQTGSILEVRNALRSRMRELRSFFNKNTPKQLICSDQPSTYDMAILDDMEVELDNRSALVTVTFLVLEGFSRAITPTVTTTSQPGKITITNDGDFLVPCTIKGTAIAPTIKIIGEMTGEALTILNASAGAQIEIDTGLEIYREAGVNKMQKIPAESDFVHLAPGSNTLNIIGLSNITVTAEWRFL